MESWRRMAWGGGMIAVIALAIALAWFSVLLTADGRHQDALEPLVPTPVAALSDTPDDETNYRQMGERRVAIEPQAVPDARTTRGRTGVGVAVISPLAFEWPTPRPGWYLSWSISQAEIDADDLSPASLAMNPPAYAPLGMEFVPMVRMQEGELKWSSEALTALAEHNPGQTWLIGNEPDVVWQDNTTPEDYAQAYHQAYSAIKAGDPDARIAIGGLSQITPLRLAYLDRVRAAYQDEFGEPIPVDIWNMHAFVLREERDNWGVGIPPGFDDVTHGILWEIDDHDDLRLVENQVRLMRSWMTGIGEQEKPLWISEYGILMPEEYGFAPQTVDAFMTASFDLFESLSDERTGSPDDGQRLVQRWAWFSTYYHLYPTGNLFDRDGAPTALMESMSAYLDEVGEVGD